LLDSLLQEMSKKYLKLKVRAEEQKSEPEFHETKETHEEVALNLSKEGGEKNGHIERDRNSNYEEISKNEDYVQQQLQWIGQNFPEVSTIKPPSNAFPLDTTPDYYSSNSERRDSHDSRTSSGSLFYKFLQYRENFIC